jgi:hypothetical protein
MKSAVSTVNQASQLRPEAAIRRMQDRMVKPMMLTSCMAIMNQ